MAIFTKKYQLFSPQILSSRKCSRLGRFWTFCWKWDQRWSSSLEHDLTDFHKCSRSTWRLRGGSPDLFLTTSSDGKTWNKCSNINSKYKKSTLRDVLYLPKRNDNNNFFVIKIFISTFRYLTMLVISTKLTFNYLISWFFSRSSRFFWKRRWIIRVELLSQKLSDEMIKNSILHWSF